MSFAACETPPRVSLRAAAARSDLAVRVDFPPLFRRKFTLISFRPPFVAACVLKSVAFAAGFQDVAAMGQTIKVAPVSRSLPRTSVQFSSGRT